MNNINSDNRFLKVLIAAQRTKQIQKGAHPLVQKSNTRATRIALEEIERGLISYEFNQNPDIKNERDNRDAGKHNNAGVNREAANQLSVSKLPAVGRASD